MKQIGVYTKKSTLQENLVAVSIIRNLGIGLRVGLIFINPYSTLLTMRESYRYLLRLKSSNFYHFGGLRLQLLNQTKLLEKVKNDGLLRDDYGFLNVFGYSFKHSEVEPIVEFLTNEFIPKADLIKRQFNTLKRKYEITRHINGRADQFATFVNCYEHEEINELKRFFYFLYEENDLSYCKNHADDFIDGMRCRAHKYTQVINDLDKIFLNTPIARKD